jgi:hypothetical protein
MGKHHFRAGIRFGLGPSKGRRGCRGCRRPIVYGDRCPACIAQAKARAIDRARHRHDLAGQAVERKRERKRKHRKRR